MERHGEMMKLQVLVSTVEEDVATLAERMNLESEAIIINQTDHVGYFEYINNGRRIQCYEMDERGVGLSRNNALMRATGDIVLFSDEDIVYDKGYERKVLEAFDEHPEADFLLFNMRVGAERATYYTKRYHRVHIWNAGRYPTYSFAIRRDKLHASRITFSLLFGGGARYSNGEDSLFLKDCIKYGFSTYTIPVELGEEKVRESTWFKGYTDKFFLDRGVLYHFLYGWMAYPMSVRFIKAKRKIMCNEIPEKNALALMKKGIESVKEY
jgi:glycosyltransferase involved in cell wall biosynthesis